MTAESPLDQWLAESSQSNELGIQKSTERLIHHLVDELLQEMKLSPKKLGYANNRFCAAALCGRITSDLQGQEETLAADTDALKQLLRTEIKALEELLNSNARLIGKWTVMIFEDLTEILLGEMDLTPEALGLKNNLAVTTAICRKHAANFLRQKTDLGWNTFTIDIRELKNLIRTTISELLMSETETP